MEVTLIRASMADSEMIWRMQRIAFAELLAKYQDDDTNPGNETLEKVQGRFLLPATHYYFILADGQTAGVIRVADAQDGSPKRISPLFVMPEYRGLGVAQSAIREAERIHGASGWTLATIAQEPGNCHLYEKMGYRRTGNTIEINASMCLVIYAK